VPVYIDCKDPQVKPLVKAWKAYDLPMLGFTTWNGAKVAEYEGELTAGAIAAKLAEVAAKHRRDLPWLPSLDKALDAAKKPDANKLIAVVLTDKPEHIEPLRDPALWPLVRDFLWVRARPDSDDARRLPPGDAPAVLILDAGLKPLLRLDPTKPLQEPLAGFLKSRSK
jgi:hypothetical protein